MNSDFSPDFDGLLALCARLRGADGCPWDREQTQKSLKPMLLEETYEFLDAVEQGTTQDIVDELGDVLYHLAFQIQIARERGEFDERDVATAARDKLMRRHPHVFGEAKAEGSDEVVSQWRDIKRAERVSQGKGALDGVPSSMPALAYAQALGRRASSQGFEWSDFSGVLDKVGEEIAELRRAHTADEREAEFGDVLFTLVNAARWLEVDAEDSLRKTSHKFRARFAHMERLADQRGHPLAAMPPDERETLWDEAKRVVG